MNRISAVSATGQTAVVKDGKDAASQQFSAILDRMKNGTPAQSKKEEEEESKTIIERTVVTGPDGSKMLVVTQVTIKPNGQRGETKVLSRQKIASPEAEETLDTERQKCKKEAIEPDNTARWNDTVTTAAQQKYAQPGLTGLRQVTDSLSDLV